MSAWSVDEGDCLEILRQMPDNCVDAVVTDPPYGLSKDPDMVEVLQHWLAGDDYQHRGGGFMGKAWDSFVPGPSVWREVIRVLKPGGHALAFAGSRTQDLMGLAIRLAKFEIRDSIQWLYGSGFPKSLDVAKAIDLAGGSSPKAQAETLRRRREAAGLTRDAVAAAIGCTPASVRDWEDGRARAEGGPVEWIVPSPDYRTRLADLLGYSADERRLVRAGEDRRDDRTVYGRGWSGAIREGGNTDAAREWQGWGTGLKPAHEPIVVARKPLDGTVANNVLTYGTGAMNIDACRIASGDDHREKCESVVGITSNRNGNCYGEWTGERESSWNPSGRWPANVILDPIAAEALDAQSGRSVSRIGKPRTGANGQGWGMTAVGAEYDDEGGASRFFYCAKASRSERDAGLSGLGVRNVHPTVKPISLMRYLCKLVARPGALILDPFCGSGTTGIGAVLEGMNFVGLEQDATYCNIARARIQHWTGRAPS